MVFSVFCRAVCDKRVVVMTAQSSNFSVERVAAGAGCLQVRAFGIRRHRSPLRYGYESREANASTSWLHCFGLRLDHSLPNCSPRLTSKEIAGDDARVVLVQPHPRHCDSGSPELAYELPHWVPVRPSDLVLPNTVAL
jgi:hypothetical protein